MANENIEAVEENVPAEAPQEKMIGQAQVNDLMGRARAEGAEKAKLKAEAEYQRKLQELESQKQMAQSRGNDTQEIDAEKLYQEVQERFNNDIREREAEAYRTHVVNAYDNHLANGEKAHEDFNEVTKNFNPASFPQVVVLLSGIENGGSVLYELAKNPHKLATINTLAASDAKLAQAELRKMGSSISANQEAVNQASQTSTPEPLDRMQSSNKVGNNGSMSVGDLRNQDWLRG